MTLAYERRGYSRGDIRSCCQGDILDATFESAPVNRENDEVTETFTYLDSVIHSPSNCELGNN